MTPVLETHALSVSFGGVRALVDVDLRIEPGQLVGLIGPNGAGKTTFIDAISGFVSYRGERPARRTTISSGKAPHARARLGLARTWQSIELFDDLTVRENIAVASQHLSGLGRRARGRSRAERRERAQVGRGAPALRARRPERGDAERAVAGAPEARRRRARARGVAASALSRRARRRTRHARERGARPPPARDRRSGERRCCSSTTTWGSCCRSPTTSSCSSSAR